MDFLRLYDIEIESMEISSNGAGSLTYFVKAKDKKYVVKYPSDNEINNPEVEIKVCEILVDKGINACMFIKNKAGNAISTYESGRRFTLQYFYGGITYKYNEAPKNLQAESAKMLANIHLVMKDITDMPVGIGADFIKYSSPKNTYESYKDTLSKAIDSGDKQVADLICSNMRIIERMPEFKFDINRFTCGNTHGDYMISQLIWDDSKINGVIDWTCACKHLYIWEVVRSYVFMAMEVAEGSLDIDSLINYMEKYLEISTLNSYDIENAGNFFFYFLAVCNFYGQYYDSISRNRHIYLEQAIMASKLLVWFDNNLSKLNEALLLLSTKMRLLEKVKNFYDEKGKLISYPAKRPLRELYDYRLLDRLKDGSVYWREKI